MASKKQSKQTVPENLPPNIAIGVRVSILRPHLWGGSYGEVVKHVDGVKRLIKVFGKDGAIFHTECYSNQLAIENDLWPEIQIL
jgi:hypothetical protein